MATRSTIDQIAFRYGPADSTTGVTRDAAKRLAARLGVDETQAIHLAMPRDLWNGGVGVALVGKELERRGEDRIADHWLLDLHA